MKRLFKQWVGHWLLSKLEKKASVKSAVFNSLGDVKHIAVLMELREGDALKPEVLEKPLKQLNIPFSILVVASRGQTPAIDLKNWTFFSANKTDLRSRPTAEAPLAFINRPFDLMLDLTKSNDLTVLLTAHRIKANFKAGLSSQARKPYLNFMVSGGKTNQGPQGLLAELLRYLQQINKR